ncbi:MAG TPA: translation initiation factor eIF-1A [Candidatus Nanoarchaeia archaeon]|nr:translation initiation factor eIF-1A [Candidatus Nanoarchaeia archaeon]
MAGRGNNNNIEETQEITRVRLPRGREVLGVVQQRFGGSRMKVLCLDGKTRTCRIPGRLKRTLWVRESNIVVVEPWELSGDDKGDIVFKYTKNQADFLRKNGHLKKLEEVDEF